MIYRMISCRHKSCGVNFRGRESEITKRCVFLISVAIKLRLLHMRQNCWKLYFFVIYILAREKWIAFQCNVSRFSSLNACSMSQKSKHVLHYTCMMPMSVIFLAQQSSPRIALSFVLFFAFLRLSFLEELFPPKVSLFRFDCTCMGGTRSGIYKLWRGLLQISGVGTTKETQICESRKL